MDTAELDAIIAKAEQAKQELAEVEARQSAVVDKVRANISAVVAEYGLDQIEDTVNTRTLDYCTLIRRQNEVRDRYAPQTDSEALRVAEANLVAEVEAEFANAGGRSNAEQRRAEVLKRLATDPDYQAAKKAREEAAVVIDNADMEVAIAEKQWKAAMAVYGGRVALVGAIGSIK